MTSVQTRNFYIRRRWVSIGIYSIIGSFVAAALFQHGNFLLDLTIFHYGLFIVGIIFLNHVSGARLSHFRLALYYPPFLISIPAAFILFSIWARLTSLGYDVFYPTFLECATVSLAYILFFIIQRIFHWKLNYIKHIEHSPSNYSKINASDLRGLNTDQILNWIKIEKPINSLDQDLFQFTEKANRIRNYINSSTESTIAIIGNYGSGKSSMIELVENSLTSNQKSYLWFAKINCWGFEDSTKAQEVVLKQSLETLSKYVDCLSINSIPHNYVNAISKLTKFGDVFFTVLNKSTDPLTELQRISSILLAVNARLIIIIEDTDRNGVNFNAGDLESLLFRLRDVEGISYIVTTSTSSNVDFAKLCEYTESIPNMDVDLSLRIIDIVRNHCLICYPEDIHPITYSDSLIPKKDDDFNWRDMFLVTKIHWQYALIDLLSTPRHLKKTLRRTINAWSYLHGEVDLDELLIVTALRETASPAFSFLYRNYEEIISLIRESSDSIDEKDKNQKEKSLKDNWSETTKHINFDINTVSILMREVLPSTGFLFSNIYYSTTTTKQGTRNNDAPVDYGERYFSESISETQIRDQKVLRTIDNINSETNGTDLAAKKIFNSKEFSGILGYYGDRIDRSKLIPLLSSLFNLIREKHGRKAGSEDPGFLELWSYAKDIVRKLPEYEDWIFSEIKYSIPTNIEFVNELFYLWFMVERKTGNTESVRQHIFDLLKGQFENLPTKDFVDCFNEDKPWILFQLVFTADHEKNINIHLGNATDWSWLGPLLINAAREAPERINPQITFLCRNKSQYSSDKIVFDYDDSVINGIFSNRRFEIMRELAKPYEINPHFEGYDQERLRLAIGKAQEWLDNNTQNKRKKK